MLKKIVAGVGVLLVTLAFGFVAYVWWTLQPKTDPQPLPDNLVALDATEGQARLAGAEAAADFDLLMTNYESQELRSYCGVASSVAVLSALGRDVDQGSFFTSETNEVRSRLDVMTGGMSLENLVGLLRAHDLTVEYTHASDTNASDFRDTLVRSLQNAEPYMLVNYQREVLGQRRVGHISPVAAYDEDTDSVLVMDTASYNYPPTWVPVAMLYDAMNTIDPSSGKTRGFVLITD